MEFRSYRIIDGEVTEEDVRVTDSVTDEPPTNESE